ncbi:MAG: transketolase C-terminal domain-containing protein [Spirochaetia bacterium]
MKDETKKQRIKTAGICGEVLTELGDKNPNLFVLEADLMKASGSKPFKERYEDRHINVGVAEQNLVGTAAGIAAAGAIPFACTMANFMAKRACDQVAMSVAYNNFNVKLVGCYAGLTQEENGGTHVSFIDIGIMRSLPNMTVLVPGDGEEFRQMVRWAAEYEGPVYIRMAKLLQAEILGPDYKFELGRSCLFGDGKDITIVSTGLATETALDALKVLEAEGIGARVLHMPVIKPFDTEGLVRNARETKACITIEDHSVLSGLGGLVAETLSTHHPVRVARIGLNDTFGLTADLDFQLQHFGITTENIVAQAKKLLTAV